jgi:hypothetical protein
MRGNIAFGEKKIFGYKTESRSSVFSVFRRIRIGNQRGM